jgi:hypothetical protein
MQISLLRSLIFYDRSSDKFIWKIPPREIFSSDYKWQCWCCKNVGHAVPINNQRLVIFDRRVPVEPLRAAWVHPDPTVSRGVLMTDCVAATLRHCGVDPDRGALAAVCEAIRTEEPGPSTGRRVAAILAGLAPRVHIEAAAQACAACGHQWALPWRGRRAGHHTPDLSGMTPGDSREVEAVTRAAALALARRHGVPSPRVEQLAPGQWRVTARVAGRRTRYDWQALSAVGGEIWVADADLPASGTASLRTQASQRGWHISCRREGAGYRVRRVPDRGARPGRQIDA